MGQRKQNLRHGSDAAFELSGFIPYLLNQSAEQIGKRFEAVYRDRYNLTRTQWRVLANLGAHGAMTAANVSRRTQTEKSKISRALIGFDERGLITRTTAMSDRRIELLELTDDGKSLYQELSKVAGDFDRALRVRLGDERSTLLEEILRELAAAI